MRKNDNFEWNVGSPPPLLQSHSAAKLKLIEHYLAQYFDTVVPDPRSDRLQISLVDGFCGGGAFESSDGAIVAGTPTLMLKAVEAAEKRLNKSRRKKLTIDARYYFVDKSPKAINYLKRELHRIGFGAQVDNSIDILGGTFESRYESITFDILTRARAGRSIFLLDQCGYKDVPLSVCRYILETLPRSEIILTFAIDWLIDYLSANVSSLKAVAPVEISEDQVSRFLETKGLRGHRYLVQRLIIRQLQSGTGAPYFTPFFIRSRDAGRDLWLIHLSKHPTARNVMTSSHWALQNASIHQGKAGLNMLGFDPHWEDALPLDFEFDGNAEAQTADALQNDIPCRVESMDSHGPITFDAFQRAIANDTAARIDQIENALMTLHDRQDIEILTPSGQLKRSDARLKNTDRIQLSRQLFLPGINYPNR